MLHSNNFGPFAAVAGTGSLKTSESVHQDMHPVRAIDALFLYAGVCFLAYGGLVFGMADRLALLAYGATGAIFLAIGAHGLTRPIEERDRTAFGVAGYVLTALCVALTLLLVSSAILA